jgi:precorrin-2 methylase
MRNNLERSNDKKVQQGSLAIVGTGITAIAHLTLESIGYIKEADIVFYHVNSGVTATHIRELNPSITSRK